MKKLNKRDSLLSNTVEGYACACRSCNCYCTCMCSNPNPGKQAAEDDYVVAYASATVWDNADDASSNNYAK